MQYLLQKRREIYILGAIMLVAVGLTIGTYSARLSSPTVPTTGSLTSSFGKKEFFETFYTQAQKDPYQRLSNPSAVIVPHHLLVGNLVAKVFESIQHLSPKRIILVSPNHFSIGDGRAIGTILPWKTPYGELSPDVQLGKKLEEMGMVHLQDWPFKKEHGVSNIVSFIKKTFPDTKVFPLIVKDKMTKKEAEELAQILAQEVGEDALMIGSFDFSHYMPDSVADLHDYTSIAALQRRDLDTIMRLDIDSRPGLVLLTHYAHLKADHEFMLLENYNSFDVLGEKSTQETTSYVTGYFGKGDSKSVKKEGVTMKFFGDMMLDRYVRKAIEEKGPLYPFEKIQRLISGTDLTIANFEGTMTTSAPLPLNPHNAQFTFDPHMAPILSQLGFTHFSLANNHSHDFTQKGVEQTRTYIQDNGMVFFGDYLNKEAMSVVREVDGKKIGLIGYNALYKNGYEEVKAKITELRKEVDFLVVFPHWGVEFQSAFSKVQQEKAHTFIDLGADVVIGAHPHVVQPMEVYKNHMIFYSLGNFIFDQYQLPETKQGLGIGVLLTDKEVQYTLIPMGMHNLQAIVLDKEEGKRMVENVVNKSLLTPEQKQTAKDTMRLTLPFLP